MHLRAGSLLFLLRLPAGLRLRLPAEKSGTKINILPSLRKGEWKNLKIKSNWLNVDFL
jgi:hypothetical protein